MNFKIYCLTLENTQRHTNQKQQLAELDIPYQFIFGKNFSDEFIDKNVDKSAAAWHKSQFSDQPGFLNRTYSCAYGHAECLNQFVLDSNVDYGLIIEDDCILPKNIKTKLIEVIQKIQGYNIWHLATEAIEQMLARQKNQKYELTSDIKKVPTFNKSAMAYLVNKTGAIELICQIGKIHGPSDVIQFSKKRNNYAVVFGTEIQANYSASLNSTIGIN